MAEVADLDLLKARLAEQARALGFAAVGFAPAADDPLRARRLHEWIAEVPLFAHECSCSC